MQANGLVDLFVDLPSGFDVALQLCLGWFLARTFVGAKRPDDTLDLQLELLRVLAPSSEVGCHAREDSLRLPALPVTGEQVTVKVQRNQGQYLLLALFHELAFLLERGILIEFGDYIPAWSIPLQRQSRPHWQEPPASPALAGAGGTGFVT